MQSSCHAKVNSAGITIIGGAYIEICSFPERFLFRGSGGRAAAFLSSIDVDVTLITELGKKDGSYFKQIAKNYYYQLKSINERKEIIFYYSYPLAVPHITYSQDDDKLSEQEIIEGENVLIYGMLEGNPQVHAQRVVYDPQNGINAQHFSANGSSARELAIVLSLSEGIALSGKDTPEEIAQSLIATPSTVIVVVKCGPKGACVCTHEAIRWISPYNTERIYKIGSGDIFSAAFTYAWITKSQDPFISALFASRCCAQYVETGIDRIGKLQADEYLYSAHDEICLMSSCKMPKSNGYIYLAAPFFTMMQKYLVDEVRRIITLMGYRVFSPIHDVGHGSPKDVATKDLHALDHASAVLAILDTQDCGTIFEIGYARAKGIPVIIVMESQVQKDLTMFIGSKCKIYDDLSSGIYSACWESEGDE